MARANVEVWEEKATEDGDAHHFLSSRCPLFIRTSYTGFRSSREPSRRLVRIHDHASESRDHSGTQATRIDTE